MPIQVPANKPFFPEEDRRSIAAEISEILAGGRLTMGPWQRRFESEFAEYCGVTHAIATNSGTSALEILLRYFDVEDAEVIVPTNTFLSSANAVLFAGGQPVLADICPESLCLSPETILAKITPQTRGVMAVHIAGLVCPQIDAIRDLCQQKNLFLIEDAAHAPGAALAGKKAGALADGGAFSFYPSKPMTTGEGGMITTNDDDCAQFSQSIRCHGIAIGKESSGDRKNRLLRLGYNWRMSEFQAVVGYFQIRRLDEAIERRNRVAERYRQALSEIEGLRLFAVPEAARHSYYKFPVLLDDTYERAAVAARLLEQGVQCGTIYWPPCHLEPYYVERFKFKPGDFPVAEATLSQTLALPIYPDMTRKDVDIVQNAFREVLRRPRKRL